MPFTEQLTQALSIPVASLGPTNQAIGTNNTITAIPIKNFRRLMAHVIQGLGVSATCTAYFCGCATSNGTYVALSPNTTMVLTNAGSTVTVEGTLEVRADQFQPGQQFAQLTLTVAVQNANISAVVFGGECAYKPASQYDWALTGGSRAVV